MIDALRTGRWITRERLRVYPVLILIGMLVGLVLLAWSADGLNDSQGRPLGTDFSNVYAAGTYVREGAAALAFDPATQYRREQAIFGQATPFFGWHYPPFFLFIAAALATMPYLMALFVWQAATFPLYLATVRLILPSSRPAPLIILPAAAFSAVFVNLTHGHNGFLTAALLGGALLVLDRRPVIAGVLIGLLAYKPQFGLLIPFVLLATGRWTVIVSATATVLLLVVAATLAFGIEIWSAFLASTEFTRRIVLEEGEVGWHKMQSIFSWARMWGAGVPLAYAIQGLALMTIVVTLIRLWRSSAAFELKATALMIGSILATPYALDYDMMVLGPAIAFAVAHGLKAGFRDWEKSILALIWVTPLLTRQTGLHLGLPLGVLVMLAMFAMVARRGFSEAAPLDTRPGPAVVPV